MRRRISACFGVHPRRDQLVNGSRLDLASPSVDKAFTGFGWGRIAFGSSHCAKPIATHPGSREPAYPPTWSNQRQSLQDFRLADALDEASFSSPRRCPSQSLCSRSRGVAADPGPLFMSSAGVLRLPLPKASPRRLDLRERILARIPAVDLDVLVLEVLVDREEVGDLGTEPFGMSSRTSSEFQPGSVRGTQRTLSSIPLSSRMRRRAIGLPRSGNRGTSVPRHRPSRPRGRRPGPTCRERTRSPSGNERRRTGGDRA